jgi:hypothetical protein
MASVYTYSSRLGRDEHLEVPNEHFVRPPPPLSTDTAEIEECGRVGKGEDAIDDMWEGFGVDDSHVARNAGRL